MRPQGGFFNRFFAFLFDKKALPRLILINSIVILLVAISSIVSYLYAIQTPKGSMAPLVFYLSVPAQIEQLVHRPWTVLTYMFLHQGFFHYFFNMLVLYFGGLIFTSFLNGSKLVWTYILGGLSGAAVYIAAYNIFPVFADVLPQSLALGASASVMAVLFAAVAYTPDYSIRLLFIGQMKLKYLAMIFILIDIFSITGGNAGGHFAHLGGAMFGLIYGFILRKQFRVPSFNFKIKRPKRKSKSKNQYQQRPLTDEEYLSRKAAEQERIDAILDKISQGGYNSLSKDEKDFLFKESNRR